LASDGDSGAAYVEDAASAAYVLDAANVMMAESVFESNESNEDSGAMHIFDVDVSVVVRDCLFVPNKGDGGSGIGITRVRGDVLVQKNNFRYNKSDDGGSLFIDDIEGTVLVDECKFEDNFCQSDGATLVLKDLDATIQKCEFKENKAVLGGGLGAKDVSGTLSVVQSKFELNEASEGGAVHMHELGNVTITDSIFKENKADSVGGAVYMEEMNDSLTFEHCEITENTDDERRVWWRSLYQRG